MASRIATVTVRASKKKMVSEGKETGRRDWKL
jgi:hypothetical protein